MTISKTQKNELFPSWSDADQTQDTERYTNIPTAANLRNRKLFGIPLQSNITGECMPDETLDYYVSSAISEIEHLLDLYITPVQFVERHDYDKELFTRGFAYQKLYHSNVLYVTKYELSFFGYKNDPIPGFIDFPLAFVDVRPQEGVVQLVPAIGSAASGFAISALSSSQYWAMNQLGLGKFPSAVRITYTSGFEKDKVPFAIAELIELKAAIDVISLLAQSFQPQNSTSIGIDGVSQSTSNGGTAYFQTRMGELQDAYEKKLVAVKAAYQKGWLIDYF